MLNKNGFWRCFRVPAGVACSNRHWRNIVRNRGATRFQQLENHPSRSPSPQGSPKHKVGPRRLEPRGGCVSKCRNGGTRHNSPPSTPSRAVTTPQLIHHSYWRNTGNAPGTTRFHQLENHPSQPPSPHGSPSSTSSKHKVGSRGLVDSTL